MTELPAAEPSPDGPPQSDTLALLAEMGREFASTGDLDSALKRAVEHITRYIDAEGGALFLLDETGENLRCHACSGDTEITGLTIGADTGIVGDCVQTSRGTIVRDVSNDPRFHSGVDEKTGHTTRSILCAPMSVKDERIGAIELINKRGGDGLFDETDLALLTALAASAGFAILNARMAEQLVEQERIRRELELAAEIQRSLLPAADPDLPVLGINVPARTVSGDFFDHFRLSDGRVCFNLGDVSGKGMNAALLMAKTASIYRCLGRTVHHPGMLLQRVNAEICETATRGMFVSMVGGIYDPSRGTVRIANAGHEPVLVERADGGFDTVAAETPPLGISPLLFPEHGPRVVEIDLAGGALFVYSDGLTEGYTADGGELGADGVRLMMAQTRGEDLDVRLGALIDRIHLKGRRLRDDLTILGVDDGPAAAERAAGRLAVADVDVTPVVAVTVPSAADRLRLIRQVVGDGARTAGFGERGVHDLVLAVDEACQNVIRHAYDGRGDGEITVRLWREGASLVVEVRDTAEPVDKAKVHPRDLEDVRPGGLGTHLINEIMDEVEFLPPPEEGGNILQMRKRIEQ